MSDKMDDAQQVDESLYSRQLYVYGHEAQRRLQEANVLLIGLQGLGVEIAKNVVLSGIHSLSLLDNSIVKLNDLGSQFYLTEADVGVNTRAQASLPQLSTLNPYVAVNVVSDPVTEDLVKQYSVIVHTGATITQQLEINQWCRQHGVHYIAADTLGLMSSIFVDNGANHTIVDADGAQAKRGLIATISSTNPLVVTCDERHNLRTNEAVSFEAIEGMTSLNTLENPVKIKVLNPFSFSVPEVDGSALPDFIGTHGYFNQVKLPQERSYLDLAQALEQRPFTSDMMGDMIETHVLFLVLSEYRSQHNGLFPPHNDVATIQAIVDNARAKLQGFGVDIEADSLKARQFFNLIRASSASLSPVAAIIGGLVGQEVLKAVSGKFTPIDQFLYLRFPEAFPTAILENTQLAASDEYAITSSRYDDYNITFGRTLQAQVEAQRVFLIGAGAIGCEMLKNWAMMGVATTSGQGQIVVTDMDSIEKSNLSRQFLFRSSNVGQLKSETAASAVRVMNPQLQIEAKSLKVSEESENIYSDAFWTGLNGVYTALDNVQARLYVDSRCVFYGKPMVDSGTLGTAGNTQVVIPGKTTSYGSTVDPPEHGIPVCTLKLYPHKIEHTIQWARDVFEGDFKQGPEEVNGYVQQNNYLETLRQEQTTFLPRLKTLKARLIDQKPTSFTDCVLWARQQFEELFYTQIRNLLYQLPADHITPEGQPFWSGTKRPPTPIVFDINDKAHLDFIIAAAQLFAFNYNIHGYSDYSKIVDDLAQYVQVAWAPPSKAMATTDEEMQNHANTLEVDADQEAAQLINALPPQTALAGYQLHPVEFEKDDDSNYHIAFITACSNLRARNYNIKEASTHETKFIAGKIIPAIATTTALVTGFVCIEMYKVLQNKPVEEYRNTYASLALNMLMSSEPEVPSFETVTFPSGQELKWSLWDSLVVDLGHVPTLQEIVDYLSDEEGPYGAVVSCVMVGATMLFMDMMPPADQPTNLVTSIVDLVAKVQGQPVPPANHFVTIELSLEDQDGEELNVPPCKVRVAGF